MNMLADLRSDTVTKPTLAMRQAMVEAEVGDEVFGEDPTVAKLEATVAELLGKETAMFLPSGTMSNQIALGAQLSPGDAVLMPAFAHVARWEGAGLAASFGAFAVHVPNIRGLPEVQAFEAHAYDAHPRAPRVKALALENTHNWAGGIAYSKTELEPLLTWAKAKGYVTHLDGARLMNAQVALGESAYDLARGFDTVSLCLSKGLGAPIGSCLAGPKALRPAFERLRQRLGGGWRQAGVLAAAGLYALEHHVARLREDHLRAQALATLLTRYEVGQVQHAVDTNIVHFEVASRFASAADLAARLKASGVHFYPTGPRTARFVTHLDFDDEALAAVEAAFGAL